MSDRWDAQSQTWDDSFAQWTQFAKHEQTHRWTICVIYSPSRCCIGFLLLAKLSVNTVLQHRCKMQPKLARSAKHVKAQTKLFIHARAPTARAGTKPAKLHATQTVLTGYRFVVWSNSYPVILYCHSEMVWQPDPIMHNDCSHSHRSNLPAEFDTMCKPIRQQAVPIPDKFQHSEDGPLF